jgi:uncharacterized protein (TIGR02453 family)
MRSVLNFVKLLKENNNREWFEANKNMYETAHKEFEKFINGLIPIIKSFDKRIGTLTAKECMFRIYRDVRFSKDKSPYKPNFGAYIANGGRKSTYAGYYVHFEDKGSFLAGGVYMPSPEMLKAVRKEIYFNTDEFKKIINNKNFKKIFGELIDDKLSRPPKDFPADFEEIDLLKYKSYTFLHYVNSKIITSESYTDYAANVFRHLQPFNAFINRGIDMKE